MAETLGFSTHMLHQPHLPKVSIMSISKGVDEKIEGAGSKIHVLVDHEAQKKGFDGIL